MASAWGAFVGLLHFALVSDSSNPRQHEVVKQLLVRLVPHPHLQGVGPRPLLGELSTPELPPWPFYLETGTH